MKKKNEPDDQSEPEVGLSGKFYPLSLRPRQAGLLESPWPTLFFSLLITWLAWYSAETELNLARNEYFDFRVREAITRIEQRMQAYEQVLLGVKGLYEASVSVERAEFRSYFESLRLSDHYPGIQGVGFSLIVHEADTECRTVR